MISQNVFKQAYEISLEKGFDIPLCKTLAITQPPSKDFPIPSSHRSICDETKKKKCKTEGFSKGNIRKNIKLLSRKQEFSENQTKYIIKERTFWGKLEIEKVRRVFQEGRIKINEITVKEFDILKTKLAERDSDYIVTKLTDQKFKQFFYKEVAKRNFLEDILKAGLTKCLMYVNLAYTF